MTAANCTSTPLAHAASLCLYQICANGADESIMGKYDNGICNLQGLAVAKLLSAHSLRSSDCLPLPSRRLSWPVCRCVFEPCFATLIAHLLMLYPRAPESFPC